MLVLTRKTGQKIIINNNVEVTVLETRGDTVKLGINAPKEVTIYREEIFEEIRKTNQQAGQASQSLNLDQAIQIANQSSTQPDK